MTGPVKSKSKDRHIVLWLLGALAFESMLLLGHMGILFPNASLRDTNEKSAGVVLKTENELRRRSLNSLVWEKSNNQETVNFYDSILTLAQSTATLQLESTEVELSENTLVTIEPPQENSDQEIRLRFNRGNLRARNPFSQAKIEGEDFSVDLQPGSEMLLRQVNEKEFEVRLQKGEARVQAKSGQHKVSSGNVIRIQKGQSSSVAIDNGLHWKNTPPRRIYTHDKEADVSLKWEGSVSQIELQSNSRQLTRFPVKMEGNQISVKLGIGNHSLTLQSPNGLGPAVPVEVWRAPVVHLISPLPRNRQRTEQDVLFLWVRLEEALSYSFKLEGTEESFQKEVSSNTLHHMFHKEDDAHWSVWTKDANGFVIPPLYKYPLYLRHSPLEAPRLKAPRIRAPASSKKGAWLFNLLLPQAHADEDLFEAVFEWESVPGAQHYVIEISETADFRTPVISLQLKDTQFQWKNLKKRKYHWRVAGGNRGRMGMFSEPAILDLTSSDAQAFAGVRVRKVEVAVLEPQLPAPAVKPNRPPPEPVAAKHISRKTRIFWRGGYGLVNAQASENVKANLNGIKAMSFAIEADSFETENGWWRLQAAYSQATFKPDPEEKFPFQKDLTLNQGKVEATYLKPQSGWGRGLAVHVFPKFRRTDLESITVENKFGVVPQVKGIWGKGSSQFSLTVGTLISEVGYGLTVNQTWSRTIMSHGVLGFEVESTFLIDGSHQSMFADGMLMLGYQF